VKLNTEEIGETMTTDTADKCRYNGFAHL